MRKLMWFVIGYTAATAIGVYGTCGVWMLLMALFCAACAVGLFFCKTIWQKALAVSVLGCAVGLILQFGFDRLYLSNIRQLDQQTVVLSVELTDYSYSAGYGIAADGTATVDGTACNIRVYLDETIPLKPGDRVCGSFKLRCTVGSGDREPTFHQGKGIFLLAYSTDAPEIVQCDDIPVRYFAAVLRKNIKELLDQLFPSDVLGFARALLLGDSSLLSYEEDTAFQTSGIRHVIAVSGLHVSILFSLVFMLAGKRRGLTALLGIPVLLLFAGIAGFTPSVNRACIMQGLMILALLFNREYDPPTALSFAVLVMLAVNPLTITAVSFQLSVGCMVGIFLFSGRISSYLLDKRRFGPAKGRSLRARLTRWIVGSVSVTLSAMSTTVPLCAWYFGSVSLIGIVTNLLTLWVISFIFYGIMFSCMVGAICLPVGSAIAWCTAWLIRYVLLTAKTLASFPLAAVYTCSTYIIAWLIFTYVLFAVFLFIKEKRPFVFGCCLTATLLVCVAASWAEPMLDEYRMTVLDVGQGQCILLQYQNKRYLVDCGGASAEYAADAAAELLLSQCVSRLDGVILTHYDRDHAAGMLLLLSRLPADKLYLPDVEDTGGIRAALQTQFEDEIIWIGPESITQIQNAPVTLYASETAATDNESCLCVLFQPENCDILITGDRDAAGERKLMEQVDLPKLEVLVVGHHGSNNATCMELLNKTNPSAAIISVGQRNSYGHPSADVLERLNLFGCMIRRTDLNGTIVIRG